MTRKAGLFSKLALKCNSPLTIFVVAVVLLALLPLSSWSQTLTEEDLENWEDWVKVNESELTISKDRVFQGEIFYARFTASITVYRDVDFSNVVTGQYDITGKENESGQEVLLGHFETSVGPFPNIRSGTTLNYTLLDAPLIFPSDAPPGEYAIIIKATGAKPDVVWEKAQEKLTELSKEIGSTRYLGIATPDINLSVQAPSTVNAGDTFPLTVTVNAPQVEQVNLSLFRQKTGEGWTRISDNIPVTVPQSGMATRDRLLTAPLYDGEMKLIAQVTSFVVIGTEVTLPSPVVKSTSVRVALVAPSLTIAVSNPVQKDTRVPFTLKVNNPTSLSEEIELYVIPSWTVPASAGALGRFLGNRETISIPGQGEYSFSLSADPVSVEGSYTLKVESRRYAVGGEWVNVSPSLKAEAIVTTTTDPAASLALSPPSVYPTESFTAKVTIVNPGSSDISVPYVVNLYSSATRGGLFPTTPSSSPWQTEGKVIAAGQTETVSLTYSATTTAQQYLGFELVVDKYFVGSTEVAFPLKSQAVGYVKGIVPPGIKVTPSLSDADVAQNISLNIEMTNVMTVPISFTLEIWQREAGGQISVLGEDLVTLPGNGSSTLTPMPIVKTPNQPAIMEYGARIKNSQVNISDNVFPATASHWSQVRVKQPVLPRLTLVLNPNPAQVDSSLEVRLAITNPGDRDMTVPLSIYLKPPAAARTLWKQEDIAIVAGQSASFTRYLTVQPEWQSLGTMEVIAEIDHLVLGTETVSLSRPVKASQTLSIFNLQLSAVLRATGYDQTPSWDAVNKFLVADKVWLEGTIVVSNAGGWENAPDLGLRLEVLQSQGVETIQSWQVVEKQVHELWGGGEFSTTAKFAINNPLAGNLTNVRFTVKVTANATPAIEKTFTLGLSRVSGDSWYLDGQARLLSKATGARFASTVWDSDSDGLSDYQEIVVKGTNPLNQDTDGDGFIDSQDPAPLTFTVIISAAEQQGLEAERAQMKSNLLAAIDSFIIGAGVFQTNVQGGSAVLPTGQKAWERQMQAGQAAKDALAMLLNLLPAITPDEYQSKLADINSWIQQIDNLKSLIDEKYGDSPTPRQTVQNVVEMVAERTTDELTADADGDGLSTVTELQLGYDPHRWDSQQEGMSDGDYLALSMASSGGFAAEVQAAAAEGGALSAEEKGFLTNYMGANLLENAIAGTGVEGGEAVQENLATTVRQDMQQALENATWNVFTFLITG